jgi:predicted transglutaminase-like cysteine proteinase
MLRALVVALCLAVPPSAAAQTLYPTPGGHAAWLAERPHLAFTGWAHWQTDLALLRRVNREVNAAMKYRPEAEDVWGEGTDCEDYAVRKLEALLAAGVPRGALRLGIVRLAGEGHAVLVVRDAWVLDNRRDDPFRIDRSPLRIEAWETTGGRWSPAGGFASLADHLRWGGRPAQAPQRDAGVESTWLGKDVEQDGGG